MTNQGLRRLRCAREPLWTDACRELRCRQRVSDERVLSLPLKTVYRRSTRIIFRGILRAALN